MLVRLSILRSQFTEKGFRKNKTKRFNTVWCYCCFLFVSFFTLILFNTFVRFKIKTVSNLHTQ